MRTKTSFWLICLIATAGCASGGGQIPPEKVAEIGAREAESAARLTLEGEMPSACDTGLGKVSQGDELWGFARSFFAAGTHGMAVSLCPVDDVSTSVLMEKFYKGLREDKAQGALHAAQLDVLRDPRYSQPFFWAAFNLVGDWR